MSDQNLLLTLTGSHLLKRRLVRLFRRLTSAPKMLSRYLYSGRPKTPVFVVGCQRSGTTMMLDVLRQLPLVRAYHEGDGVILETEFFRLISEQSVLQAIETTAEPVILFKPLNDSQYLDRLLRLHPAAKAIWIYRHYRDNVNSSLAKWQDAHRAMIYEVAKGQFSTPGNHAIGERVSVENLARIQVLAKTPLSPEDGSALLWYLRNAIFFDLDLANNPDVLLCKYEDLVTEPDKYFRIIFDFLGIGSHFTSDLVSHIHARSIRKQPPKNINSEVEGLCAHMLKRIDEAYYKRPVISASRTSTA